MDPQQKLPEHFFNQLFEDDIWSHIADEMNRYAHKQTTGFSK